MESLPERRVRTRRGTLSVEKKTTEYEGPDQLPCPDLSKETKRKKLESEPEDDIGTQSDHLV